MLIQLADKSKYNRDNILKELTSLSLSLSLHWTYEIIYVGLFWG